MVTQTTTPQVSNVFPIRTKRDHERALALVDELWGSTSAADQARLEVLTILIESYEEAEEPIRHPTPIEAIEFRLDQLGMSRADLGRIIGSRARATEVLSGTRRLTLPMIRQIHDELGIPFEVLVQETTDAPTSRAARRKTRAPRRSSRK